MRETVSCMWWENNGCVSSAVDGGGNIARLVGR
jgi:hypothetical protein